MLTEAKDVHKNYTKNIYILYIIPIWRAEIFDFAEKDGFLAEMTQLFQIIRGLKIEMKINNLARNRSRATRILISTWGWDRVETKPCFGGFVNSWEILMTVWTAEVFHGGLEQMIPRIN